MALDLTGPAGGEIAILSATAQAPNQNALDWCHEGRPGHAGVFHAQA